MQFSVRASRPRSSATRMIPLKRTRFWIICMFFATWTLAIAGRMFWLQIVRHKEFEERGEKQQMRTFEVAPRRGILYDRNLHELAMTVLADSGVRSGLDVVRMLALGAKGVLLGRAWVYALAARGQSGVSLLLDLIAREKPRHRASLLSCPPPYRRR